MSAARTERLLNLLTLLLNSRRPISLREIRELDEFGAYRTEDPKSGERAFERDKAALLELGVPLRWAAPEQQDDDEDGIGGYVIDRERYFLPDLQLTASELALLSIAGTAAATLEGFAGKAAVVRALAKLGFDVEEAGRTPTLAHAPLLEGVDAARVGEHLDALHDAVARQRRVDLSYSGGLGQPGPPVQRQVDPYGLYYRQGNWYLVGYCHLRQAERTFNVTRMRTLKPVGATGAFSVPAGFDLRAHLERRPWEFPQQPPVEVSIRLAERLRSAISEIFGRRVRLEETAEGPLVHLQVSHPAALIAAVLPYGAAAEVVSPQSLRHELLQTYTTLAQRYGEAGESPSL